MRTKRSRHLRTEPGNGRRRGGTRRAGGGGSISRGKERRRPFSPRQKPTTDRREGKISMYLPPATPRGGSVPLQPRRPLPRHPPTSPSYEGSQANPRRLRRRRDGLGPGVLPARVRVGWRLGTIGFRRRVSREQKGGAFPFQRSPQPSATAPKAGNSVAEGGGGGGGRQPPPSIQMCRRRNEDRRCLAKSSRSIVHVEGAIRGVPVGGGRGRGGTANFFGHRATLARAAGAEGDKSS